MKMIDSICNNLRKKGIEIDLIQLDLLKEMVNTIQLGKSSANTFKKNKSIKKSFYVWGDVGRGKTLITRSFLDLIEEKKAIFHYIDFMQTIQNDLYSLSGKSNPLEKIAKSLSKKYRVIFIDEFQVEDVADAMIVGKLLDCLDKLNVVLYITSNAHPNDLYENGLQRKKFIDGISIIIESFNVYQLNGKTDYRAKNIASEDKKNLKKIYTEEEIISIIEKNFYNKDYNKNKFQINSREFSCRAFSKDFLWLSFCDFFIEPNGSDDYIEISKNTEWIFLSDFKSCDDDSADIIRRFISFIDICYRDGTKIKFFFDNCSHQNLYTGKKLKILWDRCLSRLTEMRTSEYLS